MAINFLTQDLQARERLGKIRKMVVGISTVLLVVNVVGVSGFLGWWWYVHQQERSTSIEVTTALKQLTEFAGVETLARQVDARAVGVEQALAANNVGKIAAEIICPGVSVVSWQYNSESQTVSISGPDVTMLEDCGKTWRQKYPDVAMVSAVQTEGIGWTTNWQFSGRTK